MLSILLGLLPDVLYFTLFLIFSKNIKEKRIRLFLLVSIIYLICIMISQYQILYYAGFVFFTYFALKLLYKSKALIIDIFIIGIAYMYLALNSYICFQFVSNDFSNYYLIAIINKIILFIPFIFKNKFNLLYNKYKSLWNRNDKIKRPIKSITLRNISLICLNVFIFIANLILIYISNIK